MRIWPKILTLLLLYLLLAPAYGAGSSRSDDAVYAAKGRGSPKSKPSKSKSAPDKKSKGGGLDKFTEPYKKKDKPASPTHDKGKPAKPDKKDKDKGGKHDDKYRPDHDYDNGAHRRTGRTYYPHTEVYITHKPRYDDDETFFKDNGFRYSHYPYCNEPAGSVYVHVMPDNVRDVMYADTPAFQFRTFYQKVKNDISAFGMYGKILTASGITIDGSGQFYDEKVNGQMRYMRYLDGHVATCGLNAGDNVAFELGMGGAWLEAPQGNGYPGLSFKSSIDYFPGKPWGVHLYGTYAWLEHKPLAKLNIDFGYHDEIALYIGYHNLINSRGYNLSGPVLGLALWF